MQPGVELMNEHAAGPAVLKGLANIEFAYLRVLDAIKQGAIVTPRNLCSKLLHNFDIRPRPGKSTHVFEIANGIATEVRECTLKIGRQAVDDLCAPSLPFLVI